MTLLAFIVLPGHIRHPKRRVVINLMRRTGTVVSSSGGYCASYFRVMYVIAHSGLYHSGLYHSGDRHGVRQTEGNIMTLGSTAA
jgi:hypothetical protein